MFKSGPASAPAAKRYVRHMNNITIDFGQMKDIAYRGVTRTAAFMGLGINAARDDQFKKYQLSNISMVHVLPDKLDDKSTTHIKEEFEKWVISNGLRELVESFGLFLDKVHTSCLLMATHKKQRLIRVFHGYPQDVVVGVFYEYG